jgi:hypothetical protein
LKWIREYEWTRAVEDQFAPIPERIVSEFRGGSCKVAGAVFALAEPPPATSLHAGEELSSGLVCPVSRVSPVPHFTRHG